MNKLPKILESHRIGNRGEAFLEFIMSKHCLMHKIVGYKDVGIDYICEWLDGDTPSRILFAIQIKTSERKNIKIKNKGVNKRLNELEIFSIKSQLFNIEPKTFTYWEGLEIPLYLFVVLKDKDDKFDCYYSRLTPLLHKKNKNRLKETRKGDFYKANNNSNFIALVRKKKMSGGFVRDLFIDSVRCSYQSGNVSYRNPKDFGLNNWVRNVIYPDILAETGSEYMGKVKEGLLLLQKLGLIKVSPDFEDRIKELKEKVTKK